MARTWINCAFHSPTARSCGRTLPYDGLPDCPRSVAGCPHSLEGVQLCIQTN